ncbi:MAG: nuclear transport factor 2 family protein [Geminicoccaceae bacterium]
MSRNVATVQAMYAAFATGDVAGILEHLDPDVEWEHSWGGRSLKWYRPRRGRDSVPGFFADLADFEFRRFEPVAFLEGDDMVAVPIRLELFVKATGKTIRDLEVHLWTFGKDGKVTQMRHLVDTLQFADATS